MLKGIWEWKTIQPSSHLNEFLPLSSDIRSANSSILPLGRFHIHTNFLCFQQREGKRGKGEVTHTQHIWKQNFSQHALKNALQEQRQCLFLNTCTLKFVPLQLTVVRVSYQEVLLTNRKGNVPLETGISIPHVPCHGEGWLLDLTSFCTKKKD